MRSWSYILGDGSVGTRDAADEPAARCELQALHPTLGVTFLAEVAPPPPLVAASPNGTPFAITVDDEGAVAATPIGPSSSM